MSKFLGTLFLFGGYCLIYAAVAHKGVFALDPWNGIFADAYDITGADTSAATTTAPAPTPVRPRNPAPTSPIVTGLDRVTAAYQGFLQRGQALAGPGGHF